MKDGITLTHLISSLGGISAVGGFLFGYIVLKVKNMISDAIKITEDKMFHTVSESKKELEIKMDKDLKELDEDQEDKHTTILLRMDLLFEKMDGIKEEINDMKVKAAERRNTDQG